MAVATYDRVFNFQNQQALTPAQPIPAQQLDAELNAVKLTFDALVSALAEIQRDDGALANESVGYDQLKPELSLGFAPPHVWATSNAYTTADAVFRETGFYRCLVKHTSGVFATDLAAGKWQLVYDFATVFAQISDQVALDGWSPEFALESDGEKRVLKIVDWVGGDGDKPAVGKYVGSSGLVDAIGDGADVRGPIGLTGDTGDVIEWHSGSADPGAGLGENGDFYLQLGTGSTGVSGDVWTKAAGAWSIGGNIRGPAGTGDVSIDGAVTAGNFASIVDGSTIEDSGFAPSDFAAAGHDHSGVYEPADANIVKSAANIADNALVVGDGGGKGIKAHASGAPGTMAFETAAGFTAGQINAASAKTTPHDDDTLGLSDSEASNVLKKLTFANLWSWVLGKLFSSGASFELTDAATIAISMATRWNFHVALGDDRTLGNPTNVKNDTAGKIEATASGADRDLDLDTDWENRSNMVFPITIPSGETWHLLYFTTRTGVPVISAVLSEP